MASYRTYNLKTSALENLLHRVFANVRLDVSQTDRKGRDYNPSEWFVVLRPELYRFGDHPAEPGRPLINLRLATMMFSSLRGPLTCKEGPRRQRAAFVRLHLEINRALDRPAHAGID